MVSSNAINGCGRAGAGAAGCAGVLTATGGRTPLRRRVLLVERSNDPNSSCCMRLSSGPFHLNTQLGWRSPAIVLIGQLIAAPAACVRRVTKDHRRRATRVATASGCTMPDVPTRNKGLRRIVESGARGASIAMLAKHSLAQPSADPRDASRVGRLGFGPKVRSSVSLSSTCAVWRWRRSRGRGLRGRESPVPVLTSGRSL